MSVQRSFLAHCGGSLIHPINTVEIAEPIVHSPAMATDPKTVAFLVDQMAPAGAVSAKPMFGEYGIYCDGKMVAMACDGQLFVKPTTGGRAFASGTEEASPYPGARPCLLIDSERWDDGDWLSELIRISTAELPLPKPKTPKKKS